MRILVSVASLLGLVGVGLGAFGAHGLSKRLSEEKLKVFNTGVQYQLIHVLGILLAVALAARGLTSHLVMIAAWFFVAGIMVFSGSLYLLAMTSHRRRWGMITPLGGLLFLAGWALLAVSALIRHRGGI